jgi:hypothetical protein
MSPIAAASLPPGLRCPNPGSLVVILPLRCVRRFRGISLHSPRSFASAEAPGNGAAAGTNTNCSVAATDDDVHHAQPYGVGQGGRLQAYYWCGLRKRMETIYYQAADARTGRPGRRRHHRRSSDGSSRAVASTLQSGLQHPVPGCARRRSRAHRVQSLPLPQGSRRRHTRCCSRLPHSRQRTFRPQGTVPCHQAAHSDRYKARKAAAHKPQCHPLRSSRACRRRGK